MGAASGPVFSGEGPAAELCKLGERAFWMPHQPENDRPMLVLVKGDRLALAVDAGASVAHVDGFYAALDKEGLPRPDLTVITHWHWDHTFGMHRADGLTVACRRTGELLAQARASLADPAAALALKQDEEHIAREYAEAEIVVALPDVAFDGELLIDLGGLTARVFTAASPHADDTVLVHVPEEGLLFLGDATCGDPFDGWHVDQGRLRALMRTIEGIDCGTCLLGHADPLGKGELLDYLATLAG